MKLLLDENLSRRIVPMIEQFYPSSSQVVLLGLERASDLEIWQYAKMHNFIIVTRDSDFFDLSNLFGSPPKIIWLQIGNTRKEIVANVLLNKYQNIQDFFLDQELNCLQIY